ncbi:hypothetical protein, partial [Enterococcus faecalis]|uniref:hypothetical protein n=1 Tax=Enterococcus faecalis TaxID=1351 RepID=UPI003D6BCCE3
MQKAVFCTLKGRLLEGIRRHIGNPLIINALQNGQKTAREWPKTGRQATAKNNGGHACRDIRRTQTV